MSTQIKTFAIEKRGRKYFACRFNQYRAKLVINEVSDGFKPGDEITLEVRDVSVRSSYGVQLKFEPVKVMTKADLAAFEYRRDIEKKLGYAKDDVERGMCRTKAILTVLEAERRLPELAEQIAALREKVEINKKADDERKKAQAAEYAEQRNQWAQEKAARKAEINNRRVLMPTSDLPPLNTPMRLARILGDRIVVFEDRGKRFRIDENDPSCGNPHLLGYEGSYGCYCYFRAATEAEVAQVERDERERAEQAAARKRTAEIGRQIETTGEYPQPTDEEGSIVIPGDRLLDSGNVYGGGTWFVVTDDHIWFVQNNGSDGGSWAHNNVRTGGAGAIGHRIPFNQEIADELRSLQAMMPTDRCGKIAA